MSAIAVNRKKASLTAAPVSAEPTETEIMDSLERGKNIINFLLEQGISVFATPATEPEPKAEQSQKSEKKENPLSTSIGMSESISASKKKKVKMVDRRRRRGGPGRVSSEDDSDSDSDSNGSLGRVSSDEDLSVLSDDLDDLDLLESLSESSSSDSEEEEEAKPSLLGASPSVSTTDATKGNLKKPGKRQFILAVNFPSASPQSAKSHDGVAGGQGQVAPPTHSSRHPIAQSQSHDKIEADSQLELLLQSTSFQSAVHIACSIAAEDNSLMALRLFTYWLQSYPIIIATCTQVKFRMCMYMHVHIHAHACTGGSLHAITPPIMCSVYPVYDIELRHHVVTNCMSSQYASHHAGHYHCR